jgi:MFS family permease
MTSDFRPQLIRSRWLIANHRREEAVEILAKLRGDLSTDDSQLATEIEQLDAIVEDSKHRRNNYINIFLGGRYSGPLHLGRRAILGFALQQIQQWTGILVIAGWATVVFGLAGFDDYKASWMAGLVNTFGIFGTAFAALVIDRLGRRKSLLASFFLQGIALFLVGALIKTSQDRKESNPAMSEALATGAAAFVFVYLWVFTSFNIVPSWLYGTEIWPQEVRSRGYSFTILGWAIGCGMTTFLIPIMLSRIGYGSFLFFGAMNVIAFPLIYFFYPEVAGKSLEEINLLFTSDSALVSKNMEEYEKRLANANGNVAVAARTLFDDADAFDQHNASASDGSEEDEKAPKEVAIEQV